MDPRAPSQPWPSGKAPVPAWTKTIGQDAYTIKRIEGNSYGIWRAAEELGTFELEGGENGLRVSHAPDLVLEARGVIAEFLATLDEREGAATREA